MGINGNNVTDFDLVDSTVKNAGNASDEHGVHLRNLFGTVANGQVNTITNSTITASSNFNLFIQNSSGTNAAGGQHDRIEIANSIFSDTPIATTGGDGITFSGRLTANMKLVLTNSTLDNNATDGIQCDAGDTSAVECTVTGTTVRDNNIGLNMSASGTATLRFDISNNPLIINRLTGDGGAQLINTYAGGASTIDGRIQNNDAMNGTQNGTGVDAIAEAANEGGTATLTILIDDNEMRNLPSIGVNGRASLGNTVGGTNTGVLNITVTNNLIESPVSFGNDGIEINSGSSAGGSGHTVCLNLAGNTVTGGQFDQDIKLRQRVGNIYNLQGLSGPYPVAVNTTVESYISSTNVPTRGLVTVTIDGAGFGNATCATPTLPVP